VRALPDKLANRIVKKEKRVKTVLHRKFIKKEQPLRKIFKVCFQVTIFELSLQQVASSWQFKQTSIIS
jgi:hypothetical protein